MDPRRYHRTALATAACLLMVLGVAAQRRAAGQEKANPLDGQPDAMAAGQAQFRETCSNCHGANAEGGQGEGQGPNLITNSQVRGGSDETLFSIIHNGVPGTAMPAFSMLSDQQIRQVVAFLKSLSATAISLNVPGKVEEGSAIFFGKGQCSTCHMIHGKGGFLGPDLTDIGASRRLDQLRDALLMRSSGGSTSGDLYGDPMAGYRAVLLKTDDGRTVRGIAKHYSNYSAQILDENGKIHLLHGPEELKKMTLREKSWMPDDYSKRLTPEEIQDVLAFLSRQAVRPPEENKSVRQPPKEVD
jgi:putative heme-binding domain-containing protein